MKNFKLSIFLFVITAILLLPRISAGDNPEYTWQYPVMNSNEFRTINHITNDLVYAGGVGGMLLKSENGGDTWIELSTPFTERINSLHFFQGDALRLAVSGPGGFIATSIDAGQNWDIRNVEVSDGDDMAAVTVELYHIRFLNENSLLAVGASKTLLISNDLGITWTKLSSADEVIYNPLNRTNWAYRGLAVSGNTIFMGLDGSGVPIQVLKSTDNGATWTTTAAADIPEPGSFHAARITDISVSADGTKAYATAAIGFTPYLINTSNSGENWAPADLSDFTHYPNPAVPDNIPNPVQTRQSISISGDGMTIISAGAVGQVLASTDGGVTWAEIYGGPRQGMRDLAGTTLYASSISTSGNWLIAGQNGLIAGSNNMVAGSAILKNGDDQRKTFTGITFFDENNGFATGYREAEVYVDGSWTHVAKGLIYKTTDGGQTWQQQDNDALTGYRWHGIAKDNNNNLWIAGEAFPETQGIVKFSSDNGATWTTDLSLEHDITGISLWDHDHVYAITRDNHFLQRNTDGTWITHTIPVTDDLLTIEVVAPKVVFIGGGRTSGNTPYILRTENGGNDWTTVFSMTGAGLIENIQFMDGGFGLAGGQWGPFSSRRNVMVTNDYGNTWTDANVPAVRRKRFFHIANSQQVTAFGHNGTIVESVNSGADFTEIDEMPTGNTFIAGFSLNANKAWAIGENSTIINYQSSETLNTAPGRFANLFPLPGSDISVTSLGYTFSWSESSDPDGGAISYTFLLESIDGTVTHYTTQTSETSVSINKTDLTDVANGEYRWRVVASNESNTESTTYPSVVDIEVLDGDFYYLSFNVTDAFGADISNAVITVGEVENPAGHYEFVVPAGTHSYTVAKDGFFPESGQATVTDSDISIDVTLHFDVPAPELEYTWQFPAINSNELRVVKHVTNDLVYAAGAGGMLLKSTDGGDTWTELYTPFTERISSLDFYQGSSLKLAASGPNGFLAVSPDGGNSWLVREVEITEDDEIVPVTQEFYNVGFLNENTLLVVGANKHLLRSDDLGNTWTKITSADDVIYNPLNRTNWAYRGIAVTENTIFIGFDGSGIPTQVFKSTDNGDTWVTVAATGIGEPGSFHASRITDINFSDNGLIGFATVAQGATPYMIKTTNGGELWENIDFSGFTHYPNPDLPSDLTNPLQARQAVDVSADGTNIVSAGAFGQVVASTDGGVNWAELFGGNYYGLRDLTGASLFGASIAPNGSWLVAGQRGIIAGSDSFVAGNVEVKSGDDQRKVFTGIVFTDEMNGYAAGYRIAEEYHAEDGFQHVAKGLFFSTTNGGDTWQESLSEALEGYRWHSLEKDNNNNLWIAGEAFPDTLGVVKFSNDNGLTWTTDLTIDHNITNLTVWDAEHIYAVTRDNMFLKRNSDGTWQTHELTEERPILAMEAVAPEVVFISGGGTTGATPFILRTEDGGEQWDVVFEITGNGLVEEIRFMDGGFGVAGGQWGSFFSRKNIMVTHDYGNTWTSLDTPIARRKQFFHIANKEYITAYGSSGDIVRSITADFDFQNISEMPSGNDYTGGFALNANQAWIIGENSTIIKYDSEQTINSAPGKFANIYPSNGDLIYISPAGFTFSWSESADPDGGDMSYTFMLESTDGETILLEQETLETSITFYDTDFDDIPEGDYRWRVVATNDNNIESTTYPGMVTINIGEAPIFTLTFVVNDQDGNAVTDAVISLDDTSYDAGVYVIDDLYAGSYNYLVSKDGYHSVAGEAIIVDADVTENVILTLITYTATFTVEDSEGSAIADAVITFDGNANDPGVYVFDNLVPGTYDYSVGKAGYHLATGEIQVVDADINQNVVLTLITYTATFIVENTEGEAIADAIITFEGTANPAGTYTFDDLAPGTYDYSVSKEGYHEVSGQIQVVDGTISETVVLEFITYSLTFNVEDEQGDVITGATIILDGEENAAGDYVFEDLIPGIYEYVVLKDGYQGVLGNVEIVDADLTQTVVLEVATFTITFNVEDENGNDIADATITFDNTEYPSGTYVFEDLLAGSYSYIVSKEGFDNVSGEATITDSDLVINIVLTEETEGYDITFNVDMSDAEGFDPAVHQVYISGGFGEQMNWPEPGTNSDLILQRVNDSMIYSISLELGAGTYEYKYASDAFGDGWDGAEWLGQPNRQIEVEDNMEIDDIWGVHPDNVNVPETSVPRFIFYPNPASTTVHIQSDDTINELRLVDLLGKVVYSAQIQQNYYQLNVSGLNNGIYFLQVTTPAGLKTERLQISK